MCQPDNLLIKREYNFIKTTGTENNYVARRREYLLFTGHWQLNYIQIDTF